MDAPVTFPLAVRARILQFAAERLGSLPAGDVPVSLQAVARFTPAKRARLGAAALATALETDPVFRQQVAERARAVLPELAAALTAGTDVPAAPPEDLAALAYLLRPVGWSAYLERAAELLDRRAAGAAGAATVDAVARLTEQLEAVRAASRDELARARNELAATTAELTAARRKIREMGDRAGRAEQAQRAAEQALQVLQEQHEGAQAAVDAELRALLDRLADSERAVAEARQSSRGGRQDDLLRLRLLLDALVGAAQGLRRELALPPTEGRPADALAPDYAVQTSGMPVQGRAEDDPALLDALLTVPATHLLVDGYNVTKTGYGALPLETQRGRLLAGLGGLVARTGAEVTVVFDGRDGAVPVAVPAPRGVRLLFSRTGETADEVLRRLVRHEPEGRPVVVVSSDKEVADGVRRSGARALPAIALVRLLDRTAR